jgi:uncharacterized circularly permuted ATP-grasp superfamily protein
VKDAIAAYHDLLDPDLAGESHRRLEDQMRLRGLFFGDRALCTVLRPRFLSPAQHRMLLERGAMVLSAFQRAFDAAQEQESVLAQFRLTDWERELATADVGLAVASPLSRLDAFFVEDSSGAASAGGEPTHGLRFTEYNAETPAGAGYNDVLTEAFYSLPIMRRFARDWELRPLPSRHHVLAELLESFAEWSGTRAVPRIAIVDWAEVPTRNEFEIFSDYFARQGIEAVIVEPAELEIRNGRLTDGKGPVDLIYKRVLTTELVERCGLDCAILEAVRKRIVCMVNPPACKVLHKKASLAVLSDERNTRLFTSEQRESIDAHIPWTRVVEERRTSFGGEEIDLLPWIADRRDRLVLKPNDEYGGKGIVLGWEASDEEWSTAIRTALAEPYIVQERITLPQEPYPSLLTGKLEVADRLVDTAPFVAHGRHVDGCLTRLGTAALLNVTAGGGSQTPTFVVERR